MANLFIIGNGFDLAHGIKSSYEHFHQYLRNKYGDFQNSKWIIPYVYADNKKCSEIDAANLVMRLVSLAEKDGNLWSDFENSLGKFDYARFFESEGFDEYTHLTQLSLEISIPLIKEFFSDWVSSIDIDKVKKIDSFDRLIDRENDYFVCFNYTSTLEKVYSAKNVCHVHGNTKENIILGHGELAKIKLEGRDDSRKIKNDRKLFKMKKEKKNRFKTRKIISRYLTFKEICLVNFSLAKNGKRGKIQRNLYKELEKMIENYLNKYRYRYIYSYSYQKEKEEFFQSKNQQIIEIENSLNKIQSLLRKDTDKALQTIINFINDIDLSVSIDNIYSIGFSYSDVDMKVIQIISLLGAKNWYLNKYKKSEFYVQKRKIRRCFYDGKIHPFDFTSS